MHNDLFINGQFDRSAIMKFAVSLARLYYGKDGNDNWSFEMRSALRRAWQRAHALRLRSLGVVAAGGREVA